MNMKIFEDSMALQEKITMLQGSMMKSEIALNFLEENGIAAIEI